MTTSTEGPERERVSRTEDEWSRHESALLRSLAELQQLARGPGWSAPEGESGVIDVVHGTQGVWQAWWMYADLHDTTEVCAIVPDLTPLLDSMSEAARDHYADVVTLMRSRPFRFRLILPAETRAHPVAASVVGELLKLGVEVRLADTSRWFSISHGRTAMIPRDWAESEVEHSTVLVMRSPAIAEVLTELFEHRWVRAAPWRRAAGSWDAVLELLAGGHDDQAVADILGVSLRTVHRKVAQAMEAYGTSTRFALGLAYTRGR